MRMLLGGFGQRCTPLQRGETVRGALTIRGHKEYLRRAAGLPASRGQNEHLKLQKRTRPSRRQVALPYLQSQVCACRQFYQRRAEVCLSELL